MDDDTKLRQLIGAGIMYVSIHPRSEKEIVTYIKKRNNKLNGSTDIQDQVLTRLKELGYIDDAVYAKRFIESRNRSRPKGKKLIQLELLRKGVFLDVIDSVFQQMIDTDGPTDIELARVVVQKKYSIWKKLSILEQKKKLFGFLQRRGFASSVIFRIIDELVEKQYNDDT